MSENTKPINENTEVVKENTTTTSNEEKKIDLVKLVENYKKRSSTKLKDEFLKSQIKIVPYLGYGTKMFLAEQIIKNTCLNGKNIYIDSCKKYILYIYTLIKYWTNIDIREEDLLVQYDLLDMYGLVEKILALIPEKEIATFKTILDMKQDDLLTNNYGIQAFINNKVNEFYPELSKAIMPLVEKLDIKLKTLDEDKISKALEKMIKFVS